MIRKKCKVSAVISSILAGAILMSACSVDTDGIADAFSNLGENLRTAYDTQNTDQNEDEEDAVSITIESSSPAEETEVEPTEPEATPTPVPTATPTPTPSPTPIPQRVDFSELTEDSLSGTIDVITEDFEESAHAEDDDEIILAVFDGNRVVISSDNDLPAVVSVNMMLDSFYLEAEGLYNRYVNEQYAAYALDPETASDTINVTVNYDYYFNGRLLAVVMSYRAVSAEDVLSESLEYVTYDLYTGQLIVPELLTDDIDAYNDAVIAEIIDGLDEDEADGVKPSDYEIEFTCFGENEDGELTLFVFAENDGTSDIYEIDIDVVEELLNRYGRIMALRSIASEGSEEEEPAEDEEADEEEEITEETEETPETEETEESAEPEEE